MTSHFQKVSAEELATIEAKVNERIQANYALEEYRNIPIAEAKNMGAMALFGEKYGDTVRRWVAPPWNYVEESAYQPQAR